MLISSSNEYFSLVSESTCTETYSTCEIKISTGTHVLIE